LEFLENKLEVWYLELIFLLGSFGTLGSLYSSQILGWEVCGLCWFQRVLMYPIPLITGSAILLEKKDIRYSILPLSLIGALVSLYHYLTIVLDPTRTCGFILPCSLSNQLYVGIALQPRTLPLSAFIVFSTITLLALKYGKKQN
jgi:disulfide bond formation protein DsbB